MTSAIPYLSIALLGQEALLLTSPLDVRVAFLRSGNVRIAWKNEVDRSAARCNAVASLYSSSSSSSSSASSFDFYIALVDDDKHLDVYRLRGSWSNESVYFKKVWTQDLPKRAVKMAWEDESTSEKRLVVGDRHGDVRTFVVPISDEEISAEEREPKRARVEGKENDLDDDDDDEDEAGTTHVGHVSFLTDFVLSSFNTDKPQHPASFIITSDRDEHIRISRWGARRAGYIALRYLLGSPEAVGSLCTVEGEMLRQLQGSSLLNVKGKQVSKNAVLISSDNSTLRLWSLHADAECGQRSDCQAVLDLHDALQTYCIVDAKRERRRDRLHGKGKAKVQRNESGMPMLEDGPEHVPAYTPVIVKLRTFLTHGDDRQAFLTFTVDGAKALFVISLASLVSSESSEEAVKHVKAIDVGLPVLDYVLHEHDGIFDAWVLSDVREEIVPETKRRQPLTLLRWSQSDQVFEQIADESHAVLQQQPQTLFFEGDRDLASSLILYDALSLFPKQEFERTEILEAVTEGGFIKGGLANYEIPGRPASKSNKQNSEWATRKREKAREVMKRRIEARLGNTTTTTAEAAKEDE